MAATTPVYVDLINGNDANDGSSFAQRKKTIASATANTIMSNGGTCRVMGTPPTDLAQTATWTDGSSTITLASALTQLLFDCTAAFTAYDTNSTDGGNVATQKGGNAARQTNIAAGFTTGRAAYFTLAGGLQNLSAYNSITFWIKTSAAVAANSIQIITYTDALGTIQDKVCLIPFATVSGVYHPITINCGTLGAIVGSVGLAFAIDPGTVNVTLQNINACNVASLHLCTVIGKNTTGESWAPISYISGTTVKIGQYYGGVTAANYAGTTETVEAWIIQPVNGAQQTQGNATTPTISGGWNTTDMSTQTCETHLAMFNLANGQNTWTLSIAGTTMDKCSSYYGSTAVVMSSTSITLSNSHLVGGVTPYNTSRASNLSSVWANYNNSAPTYDGSSTLNTIGATITDLVMNSNGGAQVTTGYVNGMVFTRITMKRNTTISGIFTRANNCIINTLTLTANTGTPTLSQCIGNTFYAVTTTNNTAYGIGLSSGSTTASGNNKIYGYTSSGNTTGSIDCGATTATSNNFIYNASIAEATIVNASAGGANPLVSFQRYGGVATDQRQYFATGTVLSTITTIYATGANAYKISPTSANATSSLPIWFNLMTIPVNASSLVTVTCRIMRDHSSITAQLRIIGGTIAGVAADVIASATATPTTITGATNATPIVITDTAHGYSNGDIVTISGVGGNTAANTNVIVTNKTANTFECYSLANVAIAGNGAYTSGGQAAIWELVTITCTPTEANGLTIRGEAYGGTTKNAYFGNVTIAQA